MLSGFLSSLLQTDTLSPHVCPLASLVDEGELPSTMIRHLQFQLFPESRPPGSKEQLKTHNFHRIVPLASLQFGQPLLGDTTSYASVHILCCSQKALAA
jgi:hypothetical protein